MRVPAEMDLADAMMTLSKEELYEVEGTVEDGLVIRPFRFNPSLSLRRVTRTA